MQNAFSTLKMLSWNLGTLCVLFYRIRKIVFLSKPKLIPKITLIKAKSIVIYHVNNNRGNNGYYEQRIR